MCSLTGYYLDWYVVYLLLCFRTGHDYDHRRPHNAMIPLVSEQVLANELRQPELEDVDTVDPMRSLATFFAEYSGNKKNDT